MLPTDVLCRASLEPQGQPPADARGQLVSEFLFWLAKDREHGRPGSCGCSLAPHCCVFGKQALLPPAFLLQTMFETYGFEAAYIQVGALACHAG